MKLDFFKMQAQGNDYIYFDFRERSVPELDFPELSQKLSKRHFQIGSDGIVLLLSSEIADAKMRIFNADGSEGKMCGSALQSTVYYLSTKMSQNEFEIETASGIKSGKVLPDTKKVKVNLGTPAVVRKTDVNGFTGSLIEIGNPHFVTFTNDLNTVDMFETGKKIAEDYQFIDDVNVEFVEVISQNEVKMKVWERGSGLTLACGTGSCASVYAGITENLLKNSVKLHSPGGEVLVEYDGEKIYLTGSVEYVFEGSVTL